MGGVTVKLWTAVNEACLGPSGPNALLSSSCLQPEAVLGAWSFVFLPSFPGHRTPRGTEKTRQARIPSGPLEEKIPSIQLRSTEVHRVCSSDLLKRSNPSSFQVGQTLLLPGKLASDISKDSRVVMGWDCGMGPGWPGAAEPALGWQPTCSEAVCWSTGCFFWVGLIYDWDICLQYKQMCDGDILLPGESVSHQLDLIWVWTAWCCRFEAAFYQPRWQLNVVRPDGFGNGEPLMQSRADLKYGKFCNRAFLK